MKQRLELFVDGDRVLRTSDKEEFEQKKKQLEESNTKYEVNIKTLYEEVIEKDKKKELKD